MKNLQVNYQKTLNFIEQKEVDDILDQMKHHHRAIHEKTGKGNDFLGWVNLPNEVDETMISDIESTVNNLKDKIDVAVVVGIGGSYLGARAVIDALNHNFAQIAMQKDDYPQIVYAGNNIGEDYLNDLIDVLENKRYAIIVISKSGTTTEPAIAFRILKNHLEGKLTKDVAKDYIVAVTDKEKGALKTLANNEGYKTYVIPDDVGGRYSVLTPVGLLPIAMAGFNIRELVNGAVDMANITSQIENPSKNPAAVYAAVRNAIYNNSWNIEILASYSPSLQYMIEWWKQLYGESEGKNGLGIFPAGVNFTCDLHSMGQYIQDGERNLFETVISVGEANRKLAVPFDEKNLDKLNFLAGKRLHDVNKMAELGTLIAHVDGGVPNIVVELPKINEYYLGQLVYFFEKACAYSGYHLGVNPFDQPGVEAYKKNMFALLGKPGFEEETEEIRKKI